MVKKMHDEDLDHDTDLDLPLIDDDDDDADDDSDDLGLASDEAEDDALADDDLPPPPPRKPPARPAPPPKAHKAAAARQSPAAVADPTIGERAAAMTADIPVQVVAVLGKKTLTMAELLQLEMGQLLTFGQPVSTMVDLVANGKLVAKGELVEIDGALGVKILKII